MNIQTGFEFREKLHEGRYTIVHRAIRNSDSVPVVLKMLKKTNASYENFARFTREYEMTASLNTSAKAGQEIAGVIGTYAFETVEHFPTIVLEDFGGDSLDRFKASVWSLDQFFNLALQVVDA